MLYHFDGMSFSSRRNFVRFMTGAFDAMPASFGALTIQKPVRACQCVGLEYTSVNLCHRP